MARILVARNDYDPITHYMHEWSKPVIEAARTRGHDVDTVDREHVTEVEMKSRIGKVNPSFVFLNGHGDDKRFYGYNGVVAIDAGNSGMLKGRLVFSRSCNCAKELGRQAVQTGCTSFIGYEYPFFNVRQTNAEVTPLRDDVSRPIWEASNMIPMALIKGSNVDESVEASHSKATKEISRLVFSKEIGAAEALRALIANDDALTYHGSGLAKI